MNRFVTTSQWELNRFLGFHGIRGQHARCGGRCGKLPNPTAMESEGQGRELYARAKRGLAHRRQEGLAELLLIACKMELARLPKEQVRAVIIEPSPTEMIGIRRRAHRELREGHSPGLIRDVLESLAHSSLGLAADPAHICRASLRLSFNFEALNLLSLNLRMQGKHVEALEELDLLSRVPLSRERLAYYFCNRAILLFCLGRMEDAYQAHRAAAEHTSTCLFEFNVFVSALMLGLEKDSRESATRFVSKIGRDWRAGRVVLRLFSAQMKDPLWRPTREELDRVNHIKEGLSGIPALVADLLGSIPCPDEAPLKPEIGRMSFATWDSGASVLGRYPLPGVYRSKSMLCIREATRPRGPWAAKLYRMKRWDPEDGLEP